MAMKVLFLSNLYPNPQEPTRATFNKQKIAHLRKLCDVVVVAPVSWFPFKELFSKHHKDIPAREVVDGLEIHHPRVFYTPKCFRSLHGLFYYLSVRPLISEIHKTFPFDVIFASWVYPDGFAAMKLAKALKKPFAVLAHGSDIHVQVKSALRRRLIAKTLKNADKVIAVSKDLGKKMEELGVDPGKISVVYDGVDHDVFSLQDKDEARRRLGISREGKIVLFVGNLLEIKGLQYLLHAIMALKNKDCRLFIVGEGSLRKKLLGMIRALSLGDRVVLTGGRSHKENALWMNAADLFCLPSLSEGVPSVVLEAFSCGTPVVATRVGGIPEVLDDGKSGVLVAPADGVDLAEGIDKALSFDWDRKYISDRMAGFSWDTTASRIRECLERERI